MNGSRDSVVIPGREIPSFRTAEAIQRGVERNILLRTWGGLGDQICAEPTLRYALKTFKDCQISLASECPELFTHLNFAKVYDLRKEKPNDERYFVFDTIRSPDSLTWEFMSHMITNCVDFPSLCAFRCQLPIADKEVILPKTQSNIMADELLSEHKKFWVAVHPGRHWQSKTFPKHWWDEVIFFLREAGVKPVLIGGSLDDNRGTVDVDARGCLDFRGQLSVMESVALLQEAPALLTNDSSPLHMAVTGAAWIFYVATCKHPDYITHWRQGQWGWRMKNMGRGGIWDVLDYCPNKQQKVSAENVGDQLLASWLPSPYQMAHAAICAIGSTAR